MANNKKLGTSFERRTCAYLASRGYWVHFITPDATGSQPFDIIAVKDGRAYAIECKTLVKSRPNFPIDRLEVNQMLALHKWKKCGNCNRYIAVEWDDKLFFIAYERLQDERSIDLREEMPVFDFQSGEQCYEI